MLQSFLGTKTDGLAYSVVFGYIYPIFKSYYFFYLYETPIEYFRYYFSPWCTVESFSPSLSIN